MAFEPIQKFFPDAAKSFGIKKIIEAASICGKFNAIVPRFFKTPEAASFVSAKSYSNKTLNIAAASPLWAQEISMRKEEIIRELNAEFGAQVIKKLKITLN